ncbi:MAG TPA: c-type cytochrome [Chryseosolibacter sp.]
MNTKINTAVMLIASVVTLTSCEPSMKTKEQNKKAQVDFADKELIKRGKYLVTTSACHDCHSPKIMTPQGPALDTTRLLSGHPKDQPLGPLVKTQDWILFNNTLTAAVGPWGVSFSANLTPDDTGIGNWRYEQFETAIRKGKSKGLENNRMLLPPMPWDMYRNMSDQDLQAIFAYLKSLPKVNNLVPAPIAPDKM